MANNEIKEIVKELLKAKTILLYPHIGIDGDGLGSSIALLIALRKLGKKCYALYDEEIPNNIMFLLEGTRDPYVTDDVNIIEDEELDLSICIDNGDYKRFPSFTEKFDKAKVTMCLDHHGTSMEFCDFNFIRPDFSACGEIIYMVLVELNKEVGNILPDLEIAKNLFTSITTDTGNFQFSNTTPFAHEIVAEFMRWGFKHNEISNLIYENKNLSEILIETKAINRMEMLENGLGVISYVSKAEMDELDVKTGETDPIVKKLRAINGVEFAAFLKEKEENVIRVSLRTKTTGDVAKIAKKHDGGGHIKASGCTLEMPLLDAYKVIKEDLILAIKEYEGRNN